MICGECGASLEAGARFCPNCGTPVGANSAPECGDCGAALAPRSRYCASCGARVAAGSGAGPAERGSQAARERKVATLLFADLVGFTSLNEAHDPEIIEAVVGRAFDRLSAEVERYEGLVEKFAGDAMLAVFGVPMVHEDDSERAVRCAFEMLQAMAELRANLEAEGRPSLSLRIGIETGEVVVNRQRATKERDRIVTGNAVNTAARLEQLAQPGQIIVGPSTYAATREAVQYEELAPVALKGKSLPVPAWRAIRVKARRFGRRAVLGLEAPMIGRDEELTLLKETVRRTVAEGRPHLVTVLASAGVGKSRLSWELEKYLDGLPETYHWRKGRCLAYAQMSYSALADAIAADVSVLEDDGAVAVESKLSARLSDLAGATAPQEVGAAARVLLGLESAGGMAKAELFEAWRTYLELIARRSPLVLVLEDIHWADEGLLDVIEFLARWAEAPIMILCLSRHELLERRPAWAGGLPNATTIVLEPLSPDESRRLLGALLGSSLPRGLERRVIEVAEGNPLFAEELVRLFVDRGVVRRTDAGWEQALPIEEVEIPQSIQALLAARLDSLPADEKRLSQDAAVVGRVFWDRLLAHLASQSPAATDRLLRSLRVKELVVLRESSTLADAREYAFRHVLIRDVAYDSLPKLERARKHREVARWAEDRLGERAEEVVELLAAHYWSALRYEEEFATDETALADIRRRTVDYARSAARRAFDVSQFESAAQWMRIALEQGRKLDPSPYDLARIVVDYLNYGELNETYEARIEAVHEATDRLMALPDRSVEERKIVADLCQSHGYLMYSSTQAAPDDAKAMMRRGLDILEGIGPCAERARVLHRLGWIGWRAGPIQEAEAPLRQALAEARACGDDRIERWAMHDLGIVLTFRSSEPSVQQRSRLNSEGLRLLEQSMKLARASSDVFLLTRCYSNVPATLWTLGRLDEAIAISEEGLESARRSGDRDSQFWIGNDLAEFYADRGELLRAAPMHEEAAAAAHRIGRGALAGLNQYALTLLSLGRFEEARSAWVSARALEDVPEPQAQSRATHLDAVFRWSNDPPAAIRRLREGIAETREIAIERYELALLLARMGVRIGDTDAAQEGSALVHELAASSINPVLDAVAAWAAGLSEADVDPAVGGRAVAEAAAALEATGRPVLAADAFTDAALLGERAGLANALTWSTHARELYERCSAVPVLEALHGATP